MLGYHIRQHTFRLSAISFIPHTTTAPGNFFPNQNAQFITKIQNDFRLLIMPQTDEIHTHLFHHFHFLYHLFLSHGSSYSCMILVPVCSPQQETLSIQHERALIYKLKRTETETFTRCYFLSIGCYSNLASI